MLYRYFEPFIEYFKLADFSDRSIGTISARINEFQGYPVSNKIRSIKKVSYPLFLGRTKLLSKAVPQIPVL